MEFLNVRPCFVIESEFIPVFVSEPLHCGNLLSPMLVGFSRERGVLFSGVMPLLLHLRFSDRSWVSSQRFKWRMYPRYQYGAFLMYMYT
jgi:hypothetical protein